MANRKNKKNSIRNNNTKKNKKVTYSYKSSYEKKERPLGVLYTILVVVACLGLINLSSSGFGQVDAQENKTAEPETVEMAVVPETVEEASVETHFLHAGPVDYEELTAAREAARRANYFRGSVNTDFYVPSGSIIEVAMSQVGNVGGEPFWSWYFGFKTAWCAIFTSWCADQLGYLESGVCPRFAAVSQGLEFFMSRGQWAPGSIVPSAGMYIFFDYDQDGRGDHVGFVASCDGETVITCEGNYNDSVCCNSFPVGHYSIMGYGMPNY